MTSTSSLVLYDYWRSSASYRVRIALGLLGLAYESRSIDLVAAKHHTPDYLSINPQALVPTLVIDGTPMTQSLAIIEYLHATRSGSTLLPSTAMDQQRVRQLSYAIAMEIHPVCNLGVVQHVQELVNGNDDTKVAWMRRFIAQGLTAFEQLLAQHPDNVFCHGNTPGMADCCLIPQLYNAERWGVDTEGFACITRVAAAASQLPAFKGAHPDNVKQPLAN